MTCFLSSKVGTVSFCIQTDERAELPIIVDPLLPPDQNYEFDLLGRPIDAKLALEQIGQTAVTQYIMNFVTQNFFLIGILLPLAVPLLHYGAKVLALLTYYFYFFADLHRILVGPFWRAVFRLPKDLTLHPSYSMYVYCCDLLCISCPEPDEFFHPDNYAQFMRIAWLINPMRFNIVNQELLRQHHAMARAERRAQRADADTEQ